MYAQGARPGGGAATAIAGYAERIFRFMDTLAAEQADDDAAAAAGKEGGVGAGVGAGGGRAGNGSTSRLMSAAHGSAYFIFDQVTPTLTLAWPYPSPPKP